MRKYSSAIFMFAVGLIFMGMHLYVGWPVYVQEAAAHGEVAHVSHYLLQWWRDTAENLQSEFIQLAVQFALLAGLFETWRITAYEKDQEELKAKIDQLTKLMEGRRAEDSNESCQ